MSPTPNIGFHLNDVEEKSVKTRNTMSVQQSPKDVAEEESQNLNFFVGKVNKDHPKPLLTKKHTSSKLKTKDVNS